MSVGSRVWQFDVKLLEEQSGMGRERESVDDDIRS